MLIESSRMTTQLVWSDVAVYNLLNDFIIERKRVV